MSTVDVKDCFTREELHIIAEKAVSNPALKQARFRDEKCSICDACGEHITKHRTASTASVVERSGKNAWTHAMNISIIVGLSITLLVASLLTLGVSVALPATNSTSTNATSTYGLFIGSVVQGLGPSLVVAGMDILADSNCPCFRCPTTVPLIKSWVALSVSVFFGVILAPIPLIGESIAYRFVAGSICASAIALGCQQYFVLFNCWKRNRRARKNGKTDEFLQHFIKERDRFWLICFASSICVLIAFALGFTAPVLMDSSISVGLPTGLVAGLGALVFVVYFVRVTREFKEMLTPVERTEPVERTKTVDQIPSEVVFEKRTE